MRKERKWINEWCQEWSGWVFGFKEGRGREEGREKSASGKQWEEKLMSEEGRQEERERER